MSRLPLAALAATVALLVAPAPAHAGPPWISVELPPNPLDRTIRGAFLLVHTYHHEHALQGEVTGRAIGLVDGRRRELRLTLQRTSRPGVLALSRTWPDAGAWVLALEFRGATALVGVAPDGRVRSVEVPTRRQGGHTVPRPVTNGEIDGALRALAAAESGGPSPALAGLVLLLPAALVLRRRARR